MRVLIAAVSVVLLSGSPPLAVSRTVSPDPIIFAGERNGAWGIFAIESTGRGLRRLTRGEDWVPVYSPDRGAIAFTRSRVIGENFRGDEVSTRDLYTMRSDGRAKRRLATAAYAPSWSPDGRRLVFARYTDSSLWIVNADGTGLRRLVEGNSPAWSPDGHSIAFTKWTGDYSEVFIVRVAGKGAARRLHSTVSARRGISFVVSGREENCVLRRMARPCLHRAR